MTTRDFIASVISSLAWPTAAVVLVLAFRTKITELLSRQMSRLKAGPVELEWDRAVAEVQSEVAPARKHAPHPASDLEPDAVPLLEVARRDPAQAILDAYGQIERPLRGLLSNAGADAPENVDARELARRAQRAGIVTDTTARAVDGVAVMRNLAAHRPSDVTVEKAVDYVTLVDAVLYALRSDGERRMAA